MNEEPIKIQTPVDSDTNLNPAPSIKQNILQNIWIRVPQKLKDVLTRFSESGIYGNKKVFWLVTGAFGLIFITILIGLVFGSGGTSTKSTKVKLVPTPIAETTSVPEAKDALMEADDRLKALRARINSLDVKMSRLSPPQVNFKVSF